MTSPLKKPTIDSRQVLAFVALARCGTFTAAAKELFLTQSAVSYAIKALEDDLGSRLVDRSGRRVSFTPSGEQFLRSAEKILQEMQLARAQVKTGAKAEADRARSIAHVDAAVPHSIRAAS
jgi:DNA-binding transcriptional LysR family regulator